MQNLQQVGLVTLTAYKLYSVLNNEAVNDAEESGGTSEEIDGLVTGLQEGATPSGSNGVWDLPPGKNVIWEDLPGKEKVLPNGKKIKITAEGGVIEQHPSHTDNGKWTTSITRPASRGKGGGGRIQKYRENP